MREESHSSHEGPLAEFVALRQEVERRAGELQQLKTLQLTIAGAVLSVALSSKGLLGLPLILPLTTYLLCCRYASTHYGLRRIAEYIEHELDPKVPGGLGWHAWIRQRREHWIPGMVVDHLFLTFPGIAIVGLVWLAVAMLSAAWPHGTLQYVGATVAWLGGAALTGMCFPILSGFRRVRRPSRSAGDVSPTEES